MTLQQGLSFAIIAGLLILFVWDRLRYDLVALLALLAAVACGIVPVNRAFSGFGNPLLPLVGSALVVSQAIGRSGVIEALLRRIKPAMRSADLQVGLLVAVVTLLSALIKNVGALAIFLPIAIQTARQNNRSPSEFLMPLSFGSLVGGMMTLIGTSPNVIISSIRQQILGRPYEMFDFLPVGFGISLITVVLVSFAWRLIPRRRKSTNDAEQPFRLDDYISEVRVPESSPVIGKTVRELEALADGEATVTALIRKGRRRDIPPGSWQLAAGDVLVLECDPQALDKLVKTAGLELVGSKDIPSEGETAPDISVVEAVITPASPMVGATLLELRLRDRFGVNLLALGRRGRRTIARLRRIRFEAGDVVVLQGLTNAMPETLATLGCLPLAGRNLQLGRPRKVFLPLVILALAVGLSGTELVPAPLAFTGAAVVIAVSGILTLKEIYDSVEWPILILLGALMPLGEGMHAVGTTDLIAGWLSNLSSILPAAGVLVVILTATMLLTPLLHHATAVIVMGPVAASLAHRLGLNVDPFLMAVAVGASCDFLSPIGHQCNTLVMGPGGYRFTDYWRLGLPLSTLVVVLGVPLILLVWPLH
jgi:di/tricarboxylate transporter